MSSVQKFATWRANPEKCDYDKLNPMGDYFSSKAQITKFKLGVGDKVGVIASGKNRSRGLISIWEVTGSQFWGKLPKDQPCWIPPHDVERKEEQWRVPVKLLVTVKTSNLSEIKPLLPKKVFNVAPSMISSAEFAILESIATKYSNQIVVPKIKIKIALKVKAK